MCAVAGIVAYHYAALEADLQELRLIRDAMAKRGPDGDGEWVSADHRVALGHRRLAIIDLSEKGRQPMTSTGQSLALSFNGEIYNYKELRQTLEAKGRVFVSDSDTEVILRLYEEKGVEMLKELRGMFAFALWDDSQKKLLLARDPYGIKPLYYADDGWTVRFASQVKALLKSPKVSKMAEPAGSAGFFLTGSVPEPFTLYQEIRQVPAGSFVWVTAAGVGSPQRYFSVAAAFQNGAFGVENNLQKALTDTVEAHLVSDVPVGLFLSSGVDSTALALCLKALRRDMTAITLAFDEFKHSAEDETQLAQETASTCGLKHRTRRLDRKEFSRDLDNFFEAMDQPSIDGINTYFISKAAHEAGLKVALSGVGADEIFGGYPSFDQIPNLVRWTGIPSRIPFLGLAFRFLHSPLSTLHSPKWSGLLEFGGTYEGAYLLRRGLFMPWELPSFISEETAREGCRRLGLRALYRESLSAAGRDSFGRVAAMESSFYLRNQLLRDADWAGMAHSLEIRTPYVDSFFLQSVMRGAGVAQLKEKRKRALVEALPAPLPARIAGRSKTGFRVPIERWLESEVSLDAWKEKQQLSAASTHWSRRWAYAVYDRMAAS